MKRSESLCRITKNLDGDSPPWTKRGGLLSAVVKLREGLDVRTEKSGRNCLSLGVTPRSSSNFKNTYFAIRGLLILQNTVGGTAPWGPLPGSFHTVISSLGGPQIPNKATQVHFRMRAEGFGANSFTSDFLSDENLTPRDAAQHNFLKSCSVKKKTLGHVILPAEQYCSWNSYN